MARRLLGITAAVAASLIVPNHVRAGKEQVQKAVERGVACLKQLQEGDGSWPAHPQGATALVGLTLLECNVPASDPALERAAGFLRKSWMDIKDGDTTYAVALTILFFDHLGDPADTTIIQALAVRLLAGQNAAGGWSYGLPALSTEDRRQLKKLMEHQVELKTKGRDVPPATRAAREKSALPKEIQHLLSKLQQKGAAAPGRMDPGMGSGDNSNTQFAILGLWAARRHGVAVEKALARTATRFRTTHHADGGWSYVASPNRRGLNTSTPSMTCAGLLGLALGYGSALEATLRTDTKSKPGKAAPAAPDLTRDPMIRSGLLYLTNVVGQPVGPGQRGGPGDMYYLLWSIERVAVAYNLPTFGEKDWYAWGSELLLAAQGGDGGWRGRFGTDIDTSFALLFLRRANFTKDLTAFMKGKAADALNVALRTRPLPGDKATANKDGAKTENGAPSVPRAEAATKPAAGKNTTPIGTDGSLVPHDASPAIGKPVVQTKIKPSGAGDANVAERVAAEAAHLGAELLKASGRPQEELLDQLKQGKGAAYTDALATAIPQLKGAVKSSARDALTVRLARMKAGTLREKLANASAEIRRSAALACAMKEEKQCIPDLIALLEDREIPVARAAHAALKDLTGEDLGSPGDAQPEARARAVAAWKGWWKKQSGP